MAQIAGQAVGVAQQRQDRAVLGARRPGDLLDALVEAAGGQDVDEETGGDLCLELVPGQGGMPGLHRQVEIAWRVGRAHAGMAPAGR